MFRRYNVKVVYLRDDISSRLVSPSLIAVVVLVISEEQRVVSLSLS